MATDPDARRKHLHSVLDRLEERLRELIACEPRQRSELSPVPKVPAIYLLSEHSKPLYVGRTRNLRDRLGGHMRPGSGRFGATFAFLLAQEEVDKARIETARPKKALEKDADFQKLFTAAKARVAAMGISYLEIPDPIEQTILEVYAAESLATLYNSFETH